MQGIDWPSPKAWKVKGCYAWLCSSTSSIFSWVWTLFEWSLLWGDPWLLKSSSRKGTFIFMRWSPSYSRVRCALFSDVDLIGFHERDHCWVERMEGWLAHGLRHFLIGEAEMKITIHIASKALYSKFIISFRKAWHERNYYGPLIHYMEEKL